MRLSYGAILVSTLISIQGLTKGFAPSEGGVSGGGGNLISPMAPDRYTDPKYAEKVVKASVVNVKDYFYKTERIYRNGLPKEELKYKKIYEALFADNVNIQEIIHRNHPEIEESQPCFDFDNLPVDGSIKSEDDTAICISAYNISKKVHVNEMAAQSAALMVHEYVELAGLNDEDAIALQTKALNDLKNAY